MAGTRYSAKASVAYKKSVEPSQWNPARLVLRFVQAFGLNEYNAERMLVTQKQIAPGGCDSE